MSGRRGFSWPLVLITMGVVFLLANFGLIPGVSALALLNLWPLLLILAGVDIAIGGRWPLAALGIDVGVIALGLVLLATQPTFIGGPFFIVNGGAPGERDVSVARESATTLSIALNAGAGRFRISGGSTTLVEAHSVDTDLYLRRANFDSGGEHADVRIDQNGNRRLGGSTSGVADVETRFASDVPTDLAVNGGAGEFVVDLSDVTLRSAHLNIGATSLTLTLPKPVAEVSIEVNAGASSIVVVVPDGVEARVTTTGAIVSLRSSNPRVTASGSTGETSGYGSAKARVTLRVTAGASSVAIR
jgi:hypothetical protein